MTEAPAGKTLLLVEDEPSIRELMARRLGRKGFTVLTASNGKEAQEIAEGHAGEIDLLVTDIVMPHMDGFTLEEHLSVRFPSIKVVFMTGHAGHVVAVRGLEESGRQYLLKPFLPEDLEAAIAKALETPQAKMKRRQTTGTGAEPSLEPHPDWRKQR